MADDAGLSRQRLHQRVRSKVVRRWERTLESDHHTNFLIFVLVFASGIFLLGIGYIALHPVPVGVFSMKDRVNQLSAAAVIHAPFACDDGKYILTSFTSSDVTIALSDERTIILPLVSSDQGAQYANPDGSFIFWNKGNEAGVIEFGKATFQNCVTRN